jgi:hypothetical protein
MAEKRPIPVVHATAVELLKSTLTVGYGANFERAEAVEESRACRAAAFPRNARGPV